MKAEQRFFFPLNDNTEQSKRIFVACRMEKDLFLQLSQMAKDTNSDLSATIRKLCRQGLKEKQNGVEPK